MVNKTDQILPDRNQKETLGIMITDSHGEVLAINGLNGATVVWKQVKHGQISQMTGEGQNRSI